MQLRTSKTIQSFHERFRKKFNFQNYTSLTAPTVFFGVYSLNDIKAIRNHIGLRIVWPAGSDVVNVDKIADVANIIIAESRWIEEDLKKMEIAYESISLCLDDLYAWKPVPLGDSLYWYGGHLSKFGKKYLPVVKSAFPNLDIIVLDHNNVSRNEMPEVYKKCFAGVRPVEHDGMSMSVAEMGLMGRMSVWNGSGPFSIPFRGEEGLIEAIRDLRKANYNYKLVAKRTRGYFIENERKWCDLVLKLCGTDELDATGIFHESIGRCASIFRIQRKLDIEKIGGLGQNQFERKWFSAQMQKLGKRQLITSKNSGFVANEFKNIDKRKGYAQEVEFLTHDKSTH